MEGRRFIAFVIARNGDDPSSTGTLLVLWSEMNINYYLLGNLGRGISYAIIPLSKIATERRLD